ncbi:MAG: PilN domain-containing protein [Chloroflexi bacterium]|nr:PilN domain-containing protein [Chloroflexota bacterium]
MIDRFDTHGLQNPEEEAEGAAGPNRIVLWLVVASLVGLFVPLYLISSTVESDNADLDQELAILQVTLTSSPPIDPEEQELSNSLASVKRQVREVAITHSDLTSNHIDWPTAMALFANYDPERMVVTGLVQMENRITLTGQADQETTVIVYTRMLEESGAFERVIVQSMTLNEPPTPTPSDASLNPAALTADNASTTPVMFTSQKFVEFVILVEIKANTP